MLQVVQYQKTGDIKVESVPVPTCSENGILVKTEYSLISAGTEKDSVSKAKSSLLQRARKQPEEVKLVLDFIKKEGLLKTYKRVKSTLDSFKQLGYSAAGIVVESKSDKFRVGDKVAIGGAGIANHSEYCSVPQNLAVKIPENVDTLFAAYTTVGSIAMQGVRQSECVVGETVAVIGLGLIGLITVQILKAAGCKVIGLDVNEALFTKAEEIGCDKTFKSTKSNIKSILAESKGPGCDSVIITAGTQSNEPVELSMEIARQRGRVVVVGAVGMDIPRNPFYKKEIDFKISCSYGPGRYDPNYEQKGIDYPYGFVRWTENRNMEAFLDLIASGKIDIKALTTHVFDVNQAEEAYNLITGKIKDDFIGILLKYPDATELKDEEFNPKVQFEKTEKPAISFVGAGTFAQNHLLPNIDANKVSFYGVATNTSVKAETVKRKFQFSTSTTNGEELIKDKNTDLVFIATQHDSHSDYVISALKNQKAVFVEKPLAITQNQLDEIKDNYNSQKSRLMVGFNRRFSPAFIKIKAHFLGRSEPLQMLYRVNAGNIPKSHWVQQAEQGGRIIGEVCHFIDTFVYLTGSSVKSVFANKISSNNDATKNDDNVSITLVFDDGSLGTILYIASGDSSLDKEYAEVHSQGKSAVMNNFKSVDLIDKVTNKLPAGNDKGISNEIAKTIEAVSTGSEMPISFLELYNVTATTFAINKSLQLGIPVEIKRI